MRHVGFRGKFLGHLFWAFIFQGLSICYNKEKSLQRLTICVNQICSSIFTKMHNLANFFWKGRQEWEKACVDSRFPPWKLNALVKIR